MGNQCSGAGSDAQVAATSSTTSMKEASTAEEVVVLCGPVVGKVTETTAIIMLEVDCPKKVTCIAAKEDGGGPTVRAVLDLPARSARSFVLKGLSPDTKYVYSFEGIAKAQVKHFAGKMNCTFRTMKAGLDIREMRVIALSCDRPRRLLQGQENPWDRLSEVCRADQCDVMLHVGDQVYTKMDGFLDRALQKMALYEDSDSSPEIRERMLANAMETLREAYRYTWGQTACRDVLSGSSHLMIWSDNDVANDFTEKYNKDGSQCYSQEFLKAAMSVYREYQRSLWDPETSFTLPSGDRLMEEWHFHQYGPLGIFMVDMRGNRITSQGNVKEGFIMSDEQLEALKDAFKIPEITCMIVASEIPFVSDSPENVKKASEKTFFLTGHWAYEAERCAALYDLCADWKAAQPDRRDVMLIGGDIHTGVHTTLTDHEKGVEIISITTSPVTNHVTPFYSPLEGKFNERYSFKHSHLAGQRNYCSIVAKFSEDGACELAVDLVGIPVAEGLNDE